MKKIIYAISGLVALFLFSCSDNFLDRPPLTKFEDRNYWRNENDLRMYVNEFYPQFFNGYNSRWAASWTPLRGYDFCDDFSTEGQQLSFPNSVPNTVTKIKTNDEWDGQALGDKWNYSWVKKANIMIMRMEERMKDKLTQEEFNHWMGVARFFRAYQHYRLVLTYGDIPYFEKDYDAEDFANLYKDRDPRGVVMDKIYDDLKAALAGVRANDKGPMNVNKMIVAAIASRIMLYEGTWQKYHHLDMERAQKYLTFCKEASEVVMNSGKYKFGSDFRSLFGSDNLAGNPEVILYRHYDKAVGVSHCIGSYSNGTESQSGVNLALIKSFICNDGNVYSKSAVDGAAKFDLATLCKTRDPRFEATFYDTVNVNSSTLIYGNKFISREGASYWRTGNHASLPGQYKSIDNVNDAPVLRYAEVVLNWIEAKQELAESFGGEAVSQSDLDQSINAIRKRPLDSYAVKKGVKQTAPLLLASLPEDPEKDADVSPLLWEIRRERRMEFIFEHTRLHDIKRWAKIQYMDNSKNVDTQCGPWVDFPKELPDFVAADPKTGKYTKANLLKVRKADGTIVTFDGTNAADMVGFYVLPKFAPRNVFGDEAYCYPVGKLDIKAYEDKGFKLTQTKAWTAFN